MFLIQREFKPASRIGKHVPEFTHWSNKQEGCVNGRWKRILINF